MDHYEIAVVCRENEECCTESSRHELFEKNDILTKLEHLLGVLPVSRKLDLDGKPLGFVGRKDGEVDLVLHKSPASKSKKANRALKLDLVPTWRGRRSQVDSQLVLQAALVVDLDGARSNLLEEPVNSRGNIQHRVLPSRGLASGVSRAGRALRCLPRHKRLEAHDRRLQADFRYDRFSHSLHEQRSPWLQQLPVLKRLKNP